MRLLARMNSTASGSPGGGAIGRKPAKGRRLPLPGSYPALGLGKLRLGWFAGLAGARVAPAAAVVLWIGAVAADVIPIANGSFESPATEFVDTRVDGWQKTPKPAWWDETAYGPWDNLVGVFANVPPGDPRHIDNCDGRQAIWLFANPEVGLFQELEARFQVGRWYQLTVGLFPGAAFPMAPGATVALSLYYRDAQSNRVSVADVTVTNTASVFSNSPQHLVDFQVIVPPVKASDPWAGQPIGVALLSTVSQMAGGYWVLDNVRLKEARPPALLGARATNGGFGFRLEAELGAVLEVLASPDVTWPLAQWTSLQTLTNHTGSLYFSEPVTSGLRRFYRVRQLP